MKKVEKAHIIKNLKAVKLVFGNGFDLFCGLKTNYSDYFFSSKEKYDKVRMWIEEIKKQDRYKSYLNINISNRKDFYPEDILDSDITVWDIFFVLKSPIINDDVLWCQIEEEIKQSFVTSQKKESLVVWDNVYKFLTRKFAFFIEDMTVNEAICACYLEHKYNCISDGEIFYDVLLKELKYFERKFGKYIKSQLLTPHYKSNALLTICKLVNLNTVDFLSIDTFNYSVIDDRKLIFNNINGTYLNPIFGIDSINIRDVYYDYCFTKNYRRMEQNYDSSLMNIDEQFENVIIFGHSLNEQDYNYFFPLFDRLKITSPDFKGKIVFAYYIYDHSKKHKIKRDLLLSVARMFSKYEEYVKGKNENRLLEILNINGNIIYYSIDNHGIILTSN